MRKLRRNAFGNWAQVGNSVSCKLTNACRIAIKPSVGGNWMFCRDNSNAWWNTCTVKRRKENAVREPTPISSAASAAILVVSWVRSYLRNWSMAVYLVPGIDYMYTPIGNVIKKCCSGPFASPFHALIKLPGLIIKKLEKLLLVRLDFQFSKLSPVPGKIHLSYANWTKQFQIQNPVYC